MHEFILNSKLKSCKLNFEYLIKPSKGMSQFKLMQPTKQIKLNMKENNLILYKKMKLFKGIVAHGTAK